MAKNENKTKPTEKSVEEFFAEVPEPMASDARELSSMMHEISGERPVLWGSIVGFGTYHYKYASGREGDWMKIGFSPRKQNISLYLSCDADEFADELVELGKHSRGRGCIYIKRLDDIDRAVLRTIVTKAYKQTPAFYDANTAQ